MTQEYNCRIFSAGPIAESLYGRLGIDFREKEK
jgi:hypothetical protein